MKKHGKIVMIILIIGLVLAEGVILWGQMQEETSAKEQYANLSQHIAQQEILIESLDEEQMILESQLHVFQQEKEEKEAAIEKLKGELEQLQAEQTRLEIQLEDTTDNRDKLIDQIDSLKHQIERLEAELES